MNPNLAKPNLTNPKIAASLVTPYSSTEKNLTPWEDRRVR